MMSWAGIAAWVVLAAPACLAGEAGRAGEGPQTAPASQPATARLVAMPGGDAAAGPARGSEADSGEIPSVRPIRVEDSRAAAGPASGAIMPRPTAAAGAATDPARRLWLESIAPPASSQPSQGLRQAIADVQRVALPARLPGQGAATRPSGAQPTAGSTTEPASQPASWATTAPVLPEKAMAQLKGLPAGGSAGGVDLADALFASGYLEAAFVAYERLVQGRGDADVKAWALYQMANCRRQTDPAAAEQLYQRVIREHASSPWSAAATAEQMVLEWLRVNKPTEVLQGAESLMAAGPPWAVSGSPRPGATSGPASGPASRAAIVHR